MINFRFSDIIRVRASVMTANGMQQINGVIIDHNEEKGLYTVQLDNGSIYQVKESCITELHDPYFARKFHEDGPIEPGSRVVIARTFCTGMFVTVTPDTGEAVVYLDNDGIAFVPLESLSLTPYPKYQGQGEDIKKEYGIQDGYDDNPDNDPEFDPRGHRFGAVCESYDDDDDDFDQFGNPYGFIYDFDRR